MQRRRSITHTFTENIVAEKAELEAQLATLKPGPQMDALRKKIRQLNTAADLTNGFRLPAYRAQHDNKAASVGGLFHFDL
jgi:hypothetical protein